MPDGGSNAVEAHAGPVGYFPYVIYRGRVCWHHHSDAMDVARRWAALARRRTQVRATQIPGWDHLLWRVVPG